MINNILGGITGATIDEANVIAAEKSRGYPSFSISGTITLLIIAACALAEPSMEAKNIFATTVTYAKPPR